MPLNSKRALKVFLCHASGDKPYVRELYKRLLREGIDAWLDQEKLLPGQDWRVEIPRAVRAADVVVICLSNKSITKEGYIQKEIKFALDVADEKPDGTIFLIPARIEDCPVPEKLSRWQWVDLFEENGYTRLLRSLKLDAETIGADKPTSYEDSDDELEQKLEQLYTEGLAAYYTEDWNKACQRFQAILSERPNHLNALEKLEEAELQRDLSKLYKQAIDANQAKDWQSAIKAWEELLKKSPEFRNAAQLYKQVKQQKQLSDLYTEAKKLHTAKKWQAVVKVFDQILALDPTHPDPDNLLPAAQQEVAEIKRLANLNNMYSQAVREIDMKRWQESRILLEQVHKSQTGFLETELLLRKVDDELRKVEENTQRSNQINTLYEQAHGLVRTKSWRKALDKIEEIRKLDSQFEDKDEIAEKAKAALVREEWEAQKLNQLAAMYADAVNLLKEEKYQESLEKWNEVKAIDPKYPDRKTIQIALKRKLADREKYTVFQFLRQYGIIVGIVGLLGILGIVTLIVAFSPVISTLFKTEPTQVEPTQVEPTPFLSQTIIEDEYGVPMVFVPSGTFMMGSNNGKEDEFPSHEVYLDAYYIDQYEVTNARYKACVQAGACESPQNETSKGRPESSYYNSSYFDEFPVIYVDWEMANLYCEWRGSRLPTEAEWENAARGPDNFRYPWGNESIDCNLANYISCPQTDTVEVNKYPRGISPYNVFNMVGNVSEWVSDWYLADYYNTSQLSNPKGPSSGFSHVIRGGSFTDSGDNLYVAKRFYRAPTVAEYNIGFRCAQPVSGESP